MGFCRFVEKQNVLLRSFWTTNIKNVFGKSSVFIVFEMSLGWQCYACTVKPGYYMGNEKRCVLIKVRSIQKAIFLMCRTGSKCSRERSATEDSSPSWMPFITRFSCGEIAFKGIAHTDPDAVCSKKPKMHQPEPTQNTPPDTYRFQKSHFSIWRGGKRTQIHQRRTKRPSATKNQTAVRRRFQKAEKKVALTWTLSSGAVLVPSRSRRHP